MTDPADSHDCAHNDDHDHAHAHVHPHGHACNHGPLSEHNESTDAICLDSVGFRYGEVEALRDVSLHIDRGCNLGIIGPNGGGKTTLLKCLLGLLPGYTGSIRIMGLDPTEVCKRGDVVGYVPQHHDFEPRFPASVRQVIEMGLCGKVGLLGRPSREDRQRVDELMEQVGISELAQRPIGDLSGGQRQRAFIARALIAGPKILLLDEPLVGVDLAGQTQFAELIQRLHQDLGLTVMIVSHDLRSIAACCEKVACLARTVHFHDSPEGLTPEILHEVFDHDIAPILNATN
jgi:zinc transport system ATP-binding protein